MKSKRIAGSAGAVLLIGGFTLSPVGGTPVSLAIPMDSDCILTCWDAPPYCLGEDEHDAWWVEQGDADYGEGYHSVSNPCWHGTCMEKHPTCEPELAVLDFEALRFALLLGDAAQLRSAMSALGSDRVRHNRKRAAIQLIGCTGEFVAHFPIDQRTALLLAD
jgi:hypothetical protein